MPIVAVNIIKVLFAAALYAFLFYVAKSMRGYVAGASTEQGISSAPGRPGKHAAETPPVAPRDCSIEIFGPGGTPSRHPIRGTVVVGRGSTADIRIEDDYASDRHAVFRVKGTTLSVEDLGSTNGTTIDGRPLTDRTDISPGTTLVLGRTKVVVS